MERDHTHRQTEVQYGESFPGWRTNGTASKHHAQPCDVCSTWMLMETFSPEFRHALHVDRHSFFVPIDHFSAQFTSTRLDLFQQRVAQSFELVTIPLAVFPPGALEMLVMANIR